MVVDKVRGDLEVGFDGAGGVCRFAGFVLIGRHDAVVGETGVLLLIGEESGWDFGVAALEPGEDTVVERSGDAVEVVEAFIEGHVGDGLGPIARSGFAGEIHTKVPFPHHSSVVALLLEKRGEGHAVVCDEAGDFGLEDSFFQGGAPRVTTGEEAVAGGGADAVGTMGVGEGEAFLREAVEVGGLEFGVGIEAGGIAEALVISVDDDDIRLGGCMKTCEEEKQKT